MTDILDDHPLVAYALLILTAIVAIGGAIVALIDSNTYTPEDYFRNLTIIAASLGAGTGVSRFLRHLSATVSASVSTGDDKQPGNEGG